MEVNEKSINCFKQNKIKYLVKDFAKYGVPEDVTREILLKRGINKWLHNRMAIINLKDEIKEEIKALLFMMNYYKEEYGKNCPIYRELVGNLKTTNNIRQRIRKICHSNRWVFPE